MKLYSYLFLFFLFFPFLNMWGQNDIEDAQKKAYLAIRLMDDGRIDESITILEECIALDPNNFDYAYEIALAYYLKEDYGEAIKRAKKLLKHKDLTHNAYALLGNAYDNQDQFKKAVRTYNKGIRRFPDKGTLFLEKGIAYERRGSYDKAAEIYGQGIAASPEHPSNYFRLSTLYLGSSNKLPGIIYGELFMNLERGSERTVAMSKILYKTYQEAITFNDSSKAKLSMCKIYLDLSDKHSTLPLCMVYVFRMIPLLVDIDTINIQNLSKIRTAFIEPYFEQDYERYPIVLFEYHKKMIEDGVFNAYNYYIFQIGNEEELENWLEENEEEFDRFIEWFTNPENYLNITKENYFLFTH